MNEPRISYHATLDDQASALAAHIAAALRVDILKTGEGALILPGGSSPRSLMTQLAQTDLPWDKITITTTDERCVPLDSEHSNAGQILRLFAAQGVNITLIPLWNHDRQEMAKDDLIRDILVRAATLVLGMGEDGHIASLFPGQDWGGKDDIILTATAPKAPKNRVSLSMDALISAHQIILLVNSHKKLSVYGAIEGESANTPLAKLLSYKNKPLSVHVID